MNNLAAAQEYLERGLSVLPLRPGSKKPIGRWRRFQSQPLAPDDARKWWGICTPAPGLGVVTGRVSRDLVVLDIEPEHVRRVLRTVTLPEGAPVVETARGGLHVYCRGQRRSGHLRVDGDHVGDIRGDGGYVVAPPTRTDAGDYGWYSGDLDGVDDLPEVPDWAEGGDPELAAAIRRVRDSVDASLPTVPSRSLRSILPTFVLAALDRPRYARRSPSELDFWVCCYCIRAGLSYAEVAALFEGSQLQENWSRVSRGNRGPAYLEQTYGSAWVHVEEEFLHARRVKCIRVVVSLSNWKSRERASFSFWDPKAKRVYSYTIPTVLADGSIAPEWAWLARAFGVAVDRGPLAVEKRRGRVVVGPRGEVRWFLPIDR